jgi:hypothetical protein
VVPGFAMAIFFPLSFPLLFENGWVGGQVYKGGCVVCCVVGEWWFDVDGWSLPLLYVRLRRYKSRTRRLSNAGIRAR